MRCVGHPVTCLDWYDHWPDGRVLMLFIYEQTRLTICEGRDGTESSNGDVLIYPDMIKYRFLLLLLLVVVNFSFSKVILFILF